jgi:cyclase
LLYTIVMFAKPTARRDFLRAFAAAPLGAVFARAAFAQAAATPIQVAKLAPKLALISGDGGNIAALFDDAGVMLVDSGYDNRTAELLRALSEQVSPQRVRLVFNTHWHADHVGGNETLAKGGAVIMAHENVTKRVSQTVTMEAFSNSVKPLPPAARPTRTLAAGASSSKPDVIEFAAEKLHAFHVEPAHTDGDSVVVFPSANVIHMGDLFFHTSYPFIDYSTGGWIGGMVAAADTLLKLADSRTRIIPGHGPLATKDDLAAYRQMLATIFDRLQALAKQGKTVDEAVAAAPTKEFDARQAAGFMKPEQFVRIAYAGLLRHKA